MEIKRLSVKNFGPIGTADVEFGDLTLLVGQQASGKSLFLQLLKLLIDKKHIKNTLESYYEPLKENNEFRLLLDLYFGKGMGGIWRETTDININDNIKIQKNFLFENPQSKKFDKNSLLKEIESKKDNESKLKLLAEYENSLKENPNDNEHLFYIPAQRIISILEGRAKKFAEYDLSTPYVLRLFSDNLNTLLQNEMNRSNAIFPINYRLKKEMRQPIIDTIFNNTTKIILEEENNQKKLKMQIENSNANIPFMTWSAGQKEFMPLLMGLYYLSPAGYKPKRGNYDFVVIEEPEMGLHPKAIQAIILQIIELLHRKYKVIVSTHSSVLLELLWAIQIIKKTNQKHIGKALADLFGMKNNDILKCMIDKNICSYFFSTKSGKTISKDISSLDAGDEDKDIAEWGGVSEFASKATDIVFKYNKE